MEGIGTSGRRRLIGTIGLVLLLMALLISTAAAAPVKVDRTSKAVPATKKQWAAIVAKAKQEGEVTIYSSQTLASLQAFAAAFTAKYGIKVNINRNSDGALAPQIAAEEHTGNPVADVWVVSSKPFALGSVSNGWVVPGIGPDLFSKLYDRSAYAKPGNDLIVGGIVLGLAWNTQLYPQGLKSYTSLLDASLAGGKVGTLDPSFPSTVDMYLYMEQYYGGKSFVEKLAAQKPQIYLTAGAEGQALTSGEISVAALALPDIANAAKQGAPVKFLLPKVPWDSPYFAEILKQAPHPDAAQLLIDFMLTKQGQSIVNQTDGVAVVKGVTDAVNKPLRVQNLKQLTPAAVAAFSAYWKGLLSK